MFVFDFEVFKYNWLVVIKNMTTGQYHEIVDDAKELERFYNEHKNDLFIGFNNKHYDDFIYKGILVGADPYYISKVIIKEDNLLKIYRLFDIKKIQLYSLDIAQDAMRGSLKEFEGFLGLDIEETSVDFDIDRELTPEEIKNTLKYCRQDVDATEYLIKFRIDAVRSKLDLIKEFNLDKASVNKTNAQLVATILNARKRTYTDELIPFDVSRIPLRLNREDISRFYTDQEIDYTRTYKTNIANVPHVLAYGGLHGAIENFHYEGEIWLVDVASYYPSLMIQYDYLSRGMPESNRQKYIDMYHDRLRMKAMGEKKKSVLYKIVLNTVYGCMKSEFNGLYDPHNCNNVCVAGQLLLIDLIEKLEPYCKLVQTNTDGLVIIPYDKDNIRKVIKEWETRTRMVMELEVASAIYQKDVNNYILVKDNDIKVRGGYVYQSSTGSKNHGGTMIRNTASILDDCVVNYFVHNILPEETIGKCDDLSKYQIISKAGGTYEKVVWEYDGKEIPANRCNRVYATLDKRAGKLYKIKQESLTKPARKDSIANQPTHSMLANKNVFDIKMLDKEYYISRAWERIKGFKGE